MEDKDGNKKGVINIGNLASLALGAIKQLTSKVEALELEVAALKKGGNK